MLLTIILQSDITGSLIRSLTDQALSLGMLAIISWNLWKKQQKQDEKIDRLQNEDRKEMMHVIQNNSNSYNQFNETMKQNNRLFTRLEELLDVKKLAMLLLCLSVAACGPSKKIQQSQREKTVNVSAIDSIIKMAVSQTQTTIERKDTLVTVPGSSVGLRLKAEDLKPLFDAQGTPQSRIFFADSMNSRLAVTVQPNGDVAIDCNTDSLLFLFQNLLRISEQRLDSINHLKVQNEHKSVNESKADTLVKVYDLWYYLKWGLGICSVLAVLFLIIKIILKKVVW